jgi:hypothetical protein
MQSQNLVAGGHMIEPRGISSQSIKRKKGISIRLLDLIANHDGLKTLCGDIGNAFITADCLEKIYSIIGLELGEQEDSVMLLTKAIYGLHLSSHTFRMTCANFLWQKEFFPMQYNCDVWMQLHEMKDIYDYICTDVDDFKIVAKALEWWHNQISSSFLLKSIEPPILPIIW